MAIMYCTITVWPLSEKIAGNKWWTFHHDVSKRLEENQDAIVNILSEILQENAEAVEIYTEAGGLLVQLRKHHFFEKGKLK